jgi:predicted P-loop ATPase
MIDPFREYFDGLAACDGTTDHIEELASTVTLTRPAERAAFTDALKKWLVAQVACALDEKIANHTALILVGEQNLGKTTWLNRLIPPVLSDYKFVGTIYPDNKDTLVYLAETMLINLDELETLRKAEIGSLKSLMTMTSIKVRRVFERFPRTFVRRTSFVGSINNANFLNDPTGSRRFLCFEVKSLDLTKVVDMDAVYGQAYSLYRSGYRYWFTDDEVKTITERNKKYQARSYEHELLNQTCSPGKIEANDGQWLSATEVAERIHGNREVFRVDDRSVRALGIALSSENYTKRRSKGAVKYYVRWVGMPEEEEAA